MCIRTVKGKKFTILIEGQQIVVQHVPGKGKRCRVIFPPGVRILDEQQLAVARDQNELSGRDSQQIGLNRPRG